MADVQDHRLDGLRADKLPKGPLSAKQIDTPRALWVLVIVVLLVLIVLRRGFRGALGG